MQWRERTRGVMVCSQIKRRISLGRRGKRVNVSGIFKYFLEKLIRTVFQVSNCRL